MSKSYKEILADIRCFVLDIDGVLTDGSLHVAENGELLRIMNVRDGYAMKAAIDAGFEIAIISGGKNEGVRKRLQLLGITNIYMGVQDKVECLDEFCDIYQIPMSQILYMGDDIPDYEVMKKVALAACPQDAAPEIKSVSHYISHVKGGRGAVRDVIEQTMKEQGKWQQFLNGQI